MFIPIDKQMFEFVQEIRVENKSQQEWAKLESCDWFQSDSYCGGYDADEAAFCFSYYHNDKVEYWFQFTLNDIEKIEAGDITEFLCRKAQ